MRFQFRTAAEQETRAVRVYLGQVHGTKLTVLEPESLVHGTCTLGRSNKEAVIATDGT